MNKRRRNRLKDESTAVVKAGWRINEWGAAVGLCRASVYNLLNAGAIKAVKVGRATVIVTSPEKFLAGCETVK